jgi:hypothetical protein
MVRPLCFAKWDKIFYFSGHQRPAAMGARKGGWPCKPSVFPTPQGVTCIQPNPHPKVSVAHQRLEKFFHFLDCGFRVFWLDPSTRSMVTVISLIGRHSPSPQTCPLHPEKQKSVASRTPQAPELALEKIIGGMFH